MISLDTLLLLEQALGIQLPVFDSFVTMGSPLEVQRANWIDRRLGSLPENLRQADLDLSAVSAGGWLNIYNPKDLVDRLNIFSAPPSTRGALGSTFSASGETVRNLESWGNGDGSGLFGPHDVYWSRTEAIATWLQNHDLAEPRRVLSEHPEEMEEALEYIRRRERWNPFFRPGQIFPGRMR